MTIIPLLVNWRGVDLLEMMLLSPAGDLEMDLSGDILSFHPIHWHLGLIVPNIFKPFNTDLYSQVQPSSAKYSLVQPSSAK